MCEKEDKYIVIKKEDLKELSLLIMINLETLLRTIASNRENDGRPTDNKYIVCNQDEPYAELVWQIILLGERAKLAESGRPASD